MFEISIAARELMLAKPSSTIGTQGRGMDRLKNEVLLLVDHIRLGAGIASPQHINQMLTMLSQRLDSCIGKLLPTQHGMAVGLMSSYR